MKFKFKKMKTLSNLIINPEKILKENDLKELKGGSYSCTIYYSDQVIGWLNGVEATSEWAAEQGCQWYAQIQFPALNPYCDC